MKASLYDRLVLCKQIRRHVLKIKFGDMRGEFGFPEAQAERKQYLLSGLRPENREIFSNPQPSPLDENHMIFIERESEPVK